MICVSACTQLYVKCLVTWLTQDKYILMSLCVWQSVSTWLFVCRTEPSEALFLLLFFIIQDHRNPLHTLNAAAALRHQLDLQSAQTHHTCAFTITLQLMRIHMFILAWKIDAKLTGLCCSSMDIWILWILNIYAGKVCMRKMTTCKWCNYKSVGLKRKGYILT